ncbi:MAG: hypothetical protein AB8G15_22910, partial [Saprospiraceae bacterium]
MKMLWIKGIGLLLCCLGYLTIAAQSSTCDCTTDINFLHEKVKKMPAYKINKQEYTLSYQKVLKALPTVQTSYECFSLMNRMVHSLNDNHAKIYGVPDSTKAVATNVLEKPISAVKRLRENLAAKTSQDKEGIYYGGENLEIGVYREANSDLYRAVILKTDSPIWQVGELIYSFLPYGNDYLLGFGGKYSNKRLISFNERISKGRFLALGWKKDKALLNFSKSPYPDTSFYRMELTDEICYLKIGSLSSFYPKRAEAEA